MSELKFKKDRRSLLYFIAIPIKGTKRHKWVCTGERSLEGANSVVSSMGVDRLLHLHNAEVLTSEAISLVTNGRTFTCMDVFELWKEWYTPRCTSSTLLRFSGDLLRLFNDTGTAKRSIAAITEHHIQGWIQNDKLSYASSTIRLCAVRSFFKFANARGYVLGNPAALVNVNRRIMSVEQLEVKPTQPFTEEEYQRILTWPKDDKMRDWSILSYCTGLRFVDCVSLEWASIGEGKIVAFPLKSRRNMAARVVLPISDPLIGRPEFLELHQRLLTQEHDDTRYVWPLDQLDVSFLNRQLGIRYSRRLVKLGIVGKSFHGLRVSFAQRLQAAGRTIEEIAASMAHANTSTTQIYLEKR